MVQHISLLIFLLGISLYYVDAFLDVLPTPPPSTTQTHPARSLVWDVTRLYAQTQDLTVPLTHADILWKVRPPPEANLAWWHKLWLRWCANLIRLDCKLKRQEPPLVLCPKGGKAVLEAYYCTPNTLNNVNDDDDKTRRSWPSRQLRRLRNKLRFRRKKWIQIGKFGFTTERGPAHPTPIQETLEDLYGITSGGPQAMLVGIAAIQYMYVEPDYRSRDLGSLALEVLSLIHAIQGVDFTVLVADDNGSGKLVHWYQQQGYLPTPKLQDLLGSPNGVHGTAMMAPTNRILPPDCFIQWW